MSSVLIVSQEEWFALVLMSFGIRQYQPIADADVRAIYWRLEPWGA